jgi:hypothetical protein
VVPDSGGRAEAYGPPVLLQPPADIYIVACRAKLAVKPANLL